MRRSLPAIILLVVSAACCTNTKTRNEQPKAVSVVLYAYPQEWSHDLPLKRPSESALHDLTKGKKLYSTILDLSRGIPISSFAAQRGAYGRKVALLLDHSATHVTEDHFLRYLPAPFYNEVGWIDWFLVRRDQNKKAVEIISGKNRGWLGQKTLISQARNGDELIGAWGF